MTGSPTHSYKLLVKGGMDSAVVRALASHQCGLGSIFRSGVICGLSLMVLDSAPRGFSPGTPHVPALGKVPFLFMAVSA